MAILNGLLCLVQNAGVLVPCYAPSIAIEVQNHPGHDQPASRKQRLSDFVPSHVSPYRSRLVMVAIMGIFVTVRGS